MIFNIQHLEGRSMLLPYISILLFIVHCSLCIVQAQPKTTFTRADSLRGNYGEFRANNDLRYYHLDIRLDPDKKLISGKVTVRFTMLKVGKRIQLDLFDNMQLHKIVWRGQEMKFVREFNAFFVDFPQTLRVGTTHSIDVHYSGEIKETGRFKGVGFDKDKDGNHWITSACQGTGASMWFPNKDQQLDEPDSVRTSVALPHGLMNVSNGQFKGSKDLGDGYTKWDWLVTYPINNYNISLNIGKYTHFSDAYNGMPLNYYVMPYNLEKAKMQFSQVKPMMGCFEKYFGEYPFKRDGFKLIEVPYSGMEHQTAVTYGNRYANGYLERDWTGVGISPRFDFIIIHESGHEWFGNSITSKDIADMWIHEGFDTYAEAVYVECLWGKEDAIKYINGYKPKVVNKFPIIGVYNVNQPGDQRDMYFKGILFLNTLRSVLNDDTQWWKLIYDYNQVFKYKTITNEDVIAFFNRYMRRNVRNIFDQYLKHPAIPTLELKFGIDKVQYRWTTDVNNFAMPFTATLWGKTKRLETTNQWQTLRGKGITKDTFKPDVDLFYMNVVVVE